MTLTSVGKKLFSILLDLRSPELLQWFTFYLLHSLTNVSPCLNTDIQHLPFYTIFFISCDIVYKMSVSNWSTLLLYDSKRCNIQDVFTSRCIPSKNARPFVVLVSLFREDFDLTMCSEEIQCLFSNSSSSWKQYTNISVMYRRFGAEVMMCKVQLQPLAVNQYPCKSSG